MSNPYARLKRILARPEASLLGTVVAIAGQSVSVRTRAGIIEAKSVESAYRVGDAVIVRGGIVQRKVLPAASVPVYHV